VVDNSPNIGQFGPAALAKEAHWQRQRRACWGRFVREAVEISAGPNRTARQIRLAHWAKGKSEAEVKTMQNWIAHLWAKRAKAEP
jgi:hypothetical protein